MDKKEPSPKYLIRISITLFCAYVIFHFISSENRKSALIFIVSGSVGFFLKYSDIGYTRSFAALYRECSLFRLRTIIIILFMSTLTTGISKAIFNHPLLYGDKEFMINDEDISLQLIIGSFMFGMGMILATCCASGTLVSLGSGSFKSLIILIFFIIGFTLSITDFLFTNYSKLPKTSPITFNFIINSLILLVLFMLTYIINYIFVKCFKKNSKDYDFILCTKALNIQIDESLLEKIQNLDNVKNEIKSKFIFSGVLGFLFGMFFLFNGSMIGISGAFGVFGATVCKFFGAEPEKWESFKGGYNRNFIENKIFNNDIYIILGAFIASAIKGEYAEPTKLTAFDYITASIGGLFMGIGAKMAYGCNIGGMTSGISSNSVHGYIWLCCGLIGAGVSVGILNMSCLKRKDRGPNGEPRKIKLEEKLPIEANQENLIIRESKGDSNII